MSTANFDLDNAAIVWSTNWSNYFAAGNTDQIIRTARNQYHVADFTFAGTGCQITCATNGTAPTIEYNLDGGGFTTLSGIPGSGAFALTAVGGQALSDTTHTMRIRLNSSSNQTNFWWQFAGGITITGAAPAISLSGGCGPVYWWGSHDSWKAMTLEGVWVPSTLPTLLQSQTQDACCRFRGNPVDIKVWWWQFSTNRCHLIQDGIDLGFTAIGSGGTQDWVSIVPAGVTLDGMAHDYEIRFACTGNAGYIQAIMLVGGDVSTPYPVWRKHILTMGDSHGVNNQKLVRGAFSSNITLTNGSTAVTGTGFSSQTSSGVALAANQYINTTNSPLGPFYKISSITDNTHLVLTANYTGTNYTGPAYFSDWTTQADTCNAYPDLLCKQLGYGSLNFHANGQVCLSKTVNSDGCEGLNPAVTVALNYRDQVGAVIVCIGYNDANTNSKVVASISDPGGGVNTTITTSSSMTLTNGQTVQIAGATGNTAINGIWTIANVSGATFTIPVTYAAGYSANSGCASRPTVDWFQASMTRLLKKLVRAFGQVPIIVCSMPPSSLAAAIQTVYDSAISASATAAGGSCQYANTAGWISTATDCTDGLHFNEIGHSKFATQLAALLSTPGTLTGGNVFSGLF